LQNQGKPNGAAEFWSTLSEFLVRAICLRIKPWVTGPSRALHSRHQYLAIFL
jgi:hypothetical protein